MACYINGRKIREFWHQGRKIREIWFGGRKIYAAITVVELTGASGKAAITQGTNAITNTRSAGYRFHFGLIPGRWRVDNHGGGRLRLNSGLVRQGQVLTVRASDEFIWNIAQPQTLVVKFTKI